MKFLLLLFLMSCAAAPKEKCNSQVCKDLDESLISIRKSTEELKRLNKQLVEMNKYLEKNGGLK